MNPSPDRGKECLPPKKRESRQGLTEHHSPLDEFKHPLLLRSRSSAGGGEGGREASDRDRALISPNPHLLHTPPPLPAPAPGLPLPLPWHMGYSPSPSHPLFQGQVGGERSGSGSVTWRDDALPSALPHHSRWLRGDGSLSLPPPASSSSTASSFKTPFPADSPEMWSYFNSGRRDSGPSLFSPSYMFSHHSLYPQEPSLVEARHRYIAKRHNGLDGPGSRTAPNSRPLILGEYGNESSSRTRLEIGQHSTHTNGGRRQQEDIITSRVHSGGPFLSDSHTQAGPEPHSSLQDRHPHGTVKATSSNFLSISPHHLGLVPRAGRGELLDPLGATTAEAQIYYTLGSVCHPSPHTQAYPLYSPSGTPLYNLQSRQHNVRNSPHSPLGPPNSHDRSQRDRDQDRDREKVLAKDSRERGKDKEKHLQRSKDQEREGERERRRDRDRDRGRELSLSNPHTSPPALQPSPPALLPHFTKGSLIELASGRLKRVEELRTDDFLRSADTSPEVHLSTCTVLLISPGTAQGFSHLQVHLTDLNTQELLKVLVEYPFFVQARGWSSCCPQRTSQLYGLPCRQLTEGDVCLALTPNPNPNPSPTPTPTHTQTQTHRGHTHRTSYSRAHRTQPPSSAAGGESASSHREEMPPPPPPPPLPHHHHHPPPLPPSMPAPPPPLPPLPPPPPRALVTESPVQVQPSTRKRRWSAPDTLLPSKGTDEHFLDLPHGSKLKKWQ